MKQRQHARTHPTLWQALADLQSNCLTLQDAYRIARAHVRAAKRQRMTRKSKRSKA